MLFRVLVCLAIIIGTPATHAQEETLNTDTLSTTHPVSRMNEAWWKERFEKRQSEKESIEQLDILLVGDSITQGWESTGSAVWEKAFGDLKSFNLGFSGDRTEHVIWRLQNGSIEGLNPGVVMLLIGTNNTGHNLDKPEDIAKGVQVIVEELKKRLPDSKVLVLAAFPYDKDAASPRRINNNQLNKIIVDLQDDEQVHFMDICDSFFDDQGNLSPEIMPDYLHLSAKGYQIWADQVNEKLRELGKR